MFMVETKKNERFMFPNRSELNMAFSKQLKFPNIEFKEKEH